MCLITQHVKYKLLTAIRKMNIELGIVTVEVKKTATSLSILSGGLVPYSPV